MGRDLVGLQRKISEELVFGIRETHNIIWCQGKGDAPLPFGGYPAPLPPLGEPQHAQTPGGVSERVRTQTKRRQGESSEVRQGRNRGKTTHIW